MNYFTLRFCVFKEILTKNGYPVNIVDKTVKRFSEKKFIKTPPLIDLTKPEKERNTFLVLPFMSNKMDDFGSKLTKLVKEFILM